MNRPKYGGRSLELRQVKLQLEYQSLEVHKLDALQNEVKKCVKRVSTNAQNLNGLRARGRGFVSDIVARNTQLIEYKYFQIHLIGCVHSLCRFLKVCTTSSHPSHFRMTKGYIYQQSLLLAATEFSILANVTLEIVHQQYSKVKVHANFQLFPTPERGDRSFQSSDLLD